MRAMHAEACMRWQNERKVLVVFTRVRAMRKARHSHCAVARRRHYRRAGTCEDAIQET